ncbi:MAG: NERD domain-containing protein [Luteolibacter sp.]
MRVAEQLRELDDLWTVIWGFYYADKRGMDREGDFLVIGPAGGMLVLEVKNTLPRWFGATGRWEGEQDNPINQLIDEWSAVMGIVRDEKLPTWVAKALCIPGEEAPVEQDMVQGIKRSMLVLKNDLANWLPQVWLRIFGDKVRFPVTLRDREKILKRFGASADPAKARSFLDHTEELFQRQLAHRFQLLDQLRDNRQLLVLGGTGTGKTWHAIEQAFRYASCGKAVLLLVYNLALTTQLQRLVAMRKLESGSVTVTSWEELFLQLTSTSLHFREGNSDKEYHVAVEPEGGGYIVTYAYGRRGNPLTTGRKTQHIVCLAEANKIHDQLVRQKTAKGYQLAGDQAQQIVHARDAGEDTGIRCQLLNAVEEDQVTRLLTDGRYCLQEKHDGRRLMIRKVGDEITGINRRGLVVSIPTVIRDAVSAVPVDVFLDGEIVGETYHAFDLLEVKGHDIRQQAYLSRYAGLLTLISLESPALLWVSTSVHTDDKVATYEELRHIGSEGVVFKEIDAPFSPGRPNSGGSQLKFKFVESASFIVTGHNAKRSVTLGRLAEDGGGIVPAGKVTIPPNHRIPAVGQVCETRYLYAFRESGSIYQPVYLGERDDISSADCTTAQLKYKADQESAAAA